MRNVPTNLGSQSASDIDMDAITIQLQEAMRQFAMELDLRTFYPINIQRAQYEQDLDFPNDVLPIGIRITNNKSAVRALVGGTHIGL